MTKVFDVAIVGYGPAGVTAGIYAARRGLKVLLLGEMPGGEVRNSGQIENWPGDGETDGLTLADKLVAHLERHRDAVTIKKILVEKVERRKDGMFICKTKAGDYETRTVIYVTGRRPRQLGVPGEHEFKNRGVSYCATCDAPLFKDQAIAVIGGGNTGAEAVIMLQRIARHIYLLQLEEKLTADKVLVDNFRNDAKVDIIYNAKTKEIRGDRLVQQLVYQDVKTGEGKTIAIAGVFVSVGAVPNTKPVQDLPVLDKNGAIKADRYGQTAVAGFFAAGDVTDIRDAQIVVAAGHGCSAALSASNYLSRQN